MAAASESNSPAPAEQGTPALPTLWSRICRWASWGIWGTIALFAISQIFLQNWDSPFGKSIPNMIAESMLVVGVLLVLIWVALFSRWNLLTKAAVLIPAVALIGGFIASIRSMDLNGDIGITFEYKWQPTQAERVAAHRAQQATIPSEAPIAALPAITPEDMPAYRGVNRDGVVIGPQIRTA